MDTVNPWKRCSEWGCGTAGFFSHRFRAVLCDRHFFERNGQLKVDVQPTRNVVTTSQPTEG